MSSNPTDARALQNPEDELPQEPNVSLTLQM